MGLLKINLEVVADSDSPEVVRALRELNDALVGMMRAGAVLQRLNSEAPLDKNCAFWPARGPRARDDDTLLKEEHDDAI